MQNRPKKIIILNGGVCRYNACSLNPLPWRGEGWVRGGKNKDLYSLFFKIYLKKENKF